MNRRRFRCTAKSHTHNTLYSRCILGQVALSGHADLAVTLQDTYEALCFQEETIHSAPSTWSACSFREPRAQAVDMALAVLGLGGVVAVVITLALIETTALTAPGSGRGQTKCRGSGSKEW